MKTNQHVTGANFGNIIVGTMVWALQTALWKEQGLYGGEEEPGRCLGRIGGFCAPEIARRDATFPRPPAESRNRRTLHRTGSIIAFFSKYYVFFDTTHNKKTHKLFTSF